MRLTLCDLNGLLVESWAANFAELPEVKIVHGSIIGIKADAIVSPANSFGFMDGGIDQVYLDNFGADLQEKVQANIQYYCDGRDGSSTELLVGQAILVELPIDGFVKYLISAPTMRVPMKIIDPASIRLAVRAALLCAIEHNLEHILMPGMGTGCGEVPPNIAAKQMRHGWDDAFNPRPFPLSLNDLWDDDVGPDGFGFGSPPCEAVDAEGA